MPFLSYLDDSEVGQGRSGVDYPGPYVLTGNEPNVGPLRKRGKFRSFLDAMQGGQGLAGGLSSFAGRGGVLGGIGKIARFLI